MTEHGPFDVHHRRYDDWFERHRAVYVSELLALRPYVPLTGTGIEIGVGTGRFAAPLGVQVGIDPSSAMLAYAALRGIRAICATAERLPFADDRFDHALIVTTLCFVADPAATLAEARRVPRRGGRLVVGFIDRDSTMGRQYDAHKADDLFYRDARFDSSGDVDVLLRASGFVVTAWAQTLAHTLPETRDIEPLRPGRGDCAFVVAAANCVK